MSNAAVMNQLQPVAHLTLQGVRGNAQVAGTSGMNQFQHIANLVLHNQQVGGSVGSTFLPISAHNVPTLTPVRSISGVSI